MLFTINNVLQVLQRYSLGFQSLTQHTDGFHRRDWQDYGAALLITIGCTLFPLTGSVSAKTALRSAAVGGLPSHIFGAILMVTYLAFDGFTSTWQVCIALRIAILAAVQDTDQSWATSTLERV